MDVRQSASRSQQREWEMWAAPSSSSWGAAESARYGTQRCVHENQCAPQSPSCWAVFLCYPTRAYQLLLAKYYPSLLQFLPLTSLFIIIFLWVSDAELHSSTQREILFVPLKQHLRVKTGLIWWLCGQWVPLRIEWGRFSLQVLLTPKTLQGKLRLLCLTAHLGA